LLRSSPGVMGCVGWHAYVLTCFEKVTRPCGQVTGGQRRRQWVPPSTHSHGACQVVHSADAGGRVLPLAVHAWRCTLLPLVCFLAQAWMRRLARLRRESHRWGDKQRGVYVGCSAAEVNIGEDGCRAAQSPTGQRLQARWGVSVEPTDAGKYFVRHW
jgi:hypothetical protein